MADVVGTVSVQAAHRFDEDALAGYLCEKLPNFSSISAVRQFHGGQSNPTFHILGDDGREYVLRKKPRGKLLPSAHAIDREYRVLNALADSEVPVPKAHFFCEEVDIIGTQFYLMEYCGGRVFTDPLLPGMSSDERGRIYDGMNDALARLHKFDWEGQGLGDFGKREDYVGRQIAIWTKQYLASKTGESAAMNHLLKWFPSNIPETSETVVAHGDFRIGNLIFHASKPEVIAILDWELSTLGHPLADLAFNCMTYHLPAGHELAGGFLGIDRSVLGIPSAEAYVEAYCNRMERSEVSHWKFFQAFSLFRTAAIMQGIYARAIQGNSSTANAHRYGETFDLVAKKASELIEQC